MYSNTQSDESLDLLAAVFLSCHTERSRSAYSTDQIIALSQTLKDLPIGIKYGCYLQFTALMQFILEKTDYGIMWSGDYDGDDGKIKTGLSSLIYSIVKKGYGDKNKISKLPLFEALDIHLNELIISVKELKGMDKKEDEIASLLGLSKEVIQKII
jgi:hypothetical protein